MFTAYCCPYCLHESNDVPHFILRLRAICLIKLSQQLLVNYSSRDANLQSFKKGRQSSKIRENKGGFSTIIREEKCKQICDLNHTFSLCEGMLVALRELNNSTILFTVLIFVLLHIFLNFSLLSLQFATFTIVQRLAHREFARELRK